MSNMTQSLNQDEIVLVKRSTLSEIVDASTSASVEKAFSKLLTLLGKSTQSGEEDFISVDYGCEVLSVSKPTFYRYLSERKFNSYKRGKKVYVLRSELVAFLKSGKRKSVDEIVSQSKS